MRQGIIQYNNERAGILTEEDSGMFLFVYDEAYVRAHPQQEHYPEMPENEHLSMKLTRLFGIEAVPSNLIRLASGERCYISKRIDRNEDGSKRHMIDFLQILELSDKYKGTMETLGDTLPGL